MRLHWIVWILVVVGCGIASEVAAQPDPEFGQGIDRLMRWRVLDRADGGAPLAQREGKAWAPLEGALSKSEAAILLGRLTLRGGGGAAGPAGPAGPTAPAGRG